MRLNLLLRSILVFYSISCQMLDEQMTPTKSPTIWRDSVMNRDHKEIRPSASLSPESLLFHRRLCSAAFSFGVFFYICILSLDTLLIFTHSFTSFLFLHLLHKNYSAMPTNVVSFYLGFLHLGPTKTKVHNLLPFPNLSAQAQQPSTAARPICAHLVPTTAGSSLFGPAPPWVLLELRPLACPAFSPAPPLSALLELHPPARRSGKHRHRLPYSSSGRPPVRRSASDRRSRPCSSSGCTPAQFAPALLALRRGRRARHCPVRAPTRGRGSKAPPLTSLASTPVVPCPIRAPARTPVASAKLQSQ
jgi:hypothetical protein